ncbi:YggT family protein [Lactobacillus colini]|uniref:YggT family protein n=1 Tax=Lactobacillus colini TaxID=1819254 RepID=A0ABS4MDN5_9LACO|nr:YggT family protein [Lactobacillus colini]MBP2057801.1 YggT family protein [Lactobacillus colini]
MILTIIGWLFRIVSTLLNVYAFLIVIYTLLTWIPSLLDTQPGRILARIVQPYLDLFERFIPPIAGLSFAPIIALLVIYFINNYILVWIAEIIVRLVV